jgi:hypothetical protein
MEAHEMFFGHRRMRVYGHCGYRDSLVSKVQLHRIDPYLILPDYFEGFLIQFGYHEVAAMQVEIRENDWVVMVKSRTYRVYSHLLASLFIVKSKDQLQEDLAFDKGPRNRL